MRMVIGRVAVCAGAVLLILASLVAVVEGVAFNRSFYKAEYKKLNSTECVGVTEDVLTQATETLLSYLEGERDSLDLQVTIDGQEREYYNEREKLHMVDVAVLNQNAILFMRIGFIAGAALVAAGVWLLRSAQKVLRTAFFGIVGVLVAFGLLGAWAAVDFGSFWTRFHHVFFSNDLWLLDPSTSLMIRMFEQTFFFDMVAKILVIFIIIVVAALVSTGLLSKKLKKI